MDQLARRVHRNVATVAVANKLARMAWAVLAKAEPYHWPAAFDTDAGDRREVA
jgi:transposase